MLRLTAAIVVLASVVLSTQQWPRARAADDVLSWWSGEAFVTSGTAAERTAKKEIAIRSGDRIRTGAQGRVTLTVRDGSLLSLEPSTAVLIEELSVTPGSSRIVVRQEYGRSWSSLPDSGYRRSYTVATATTSAVAHGTAFEVAVEGTTTTVTTGEGTVGLGVAGLIVAAGQRRNVTPAGVSDVSTAPDGHLLRFETDVGARLVVTDPFGRSCGDVPGIGVMRQIPGCAVSTGTDPILVDIRGIAWSGDYIASVFAPSTARATVRVASLSGGVLTSAGSVSAGGGGILSTRVMVAPSGDGAAATAMTELVAIRAVPVRTPPVLSALARPPAPGRERVASPAPDRTIFASLPTNVPERSIIVQGPGAFPELAAPSPSPAGPPFPPQLFPTLQPAAAGPAVGVAANPTPPGVGAQPAADLTPAPATPRSPLPAATVLPAPRTPSPTAPPSPGSAPTVPPGPAPLAPAPAATATPSIGPPLMTNVAGATVAGLDCPDPAERSVCATLFTLGAMRPGGADATNSVTITYLGATPARLMLYASAFESRSPGSSELCVGADPASRVALRITADGGVVFSRSAGGYGTLSDFSLKHGEPATGIPLRATGRVDQVWSNGDRATYEIAVHLVAAAGNEHQGCRSAITFAWYAGPT